MNPKIKEQWVAALRSGNYRQGTNALYNTASDSHCCLGVLCSLAENTGVVVGSPGVDSPFYEYGEDNDSADLPYAVVRWAGLDDPDPTIDYRGNPANLTSLNDFAGLNFNQIADLIESQL